MKLKDIKNETVKKIIKTALQNKFTVTVANIKNAEQGTTYFRIRKGGMLGWDVIAALAKRLGTNTRGLIGNNIESTDPSFFVFDTSIIISDPKTRTN